MGQNKNAVPVNLCVGAAVVDKRQIMAKVQSYASIVCFVHPCVAFYFAFAGVSVSYVYCNSCCLMYVVYICDVCVHVCLLACFSVPWLQ